MEFKILQKLLSFFRKEAVIPDEHYKIDWDSLQRDIRYTIRDRAVFATAFLHRSYTNSDSDIELLSNERLEFLGDAVLELVIREFMYEKYPQMDEGELSFIRSVLVSRKVLAEKARSINLGKYMLLGYGEEKTGGRKKESILADAFEAVIGAIYLDSGMDAVKGFIRSHMLSDYKKVLARGDVRNHKGVLLEYCQQNQISRPYYHLKNAAGREHLKYYTIEVVIKDDVLGVGEGTTKKEAEQKAAEMALKSLGID